MYRLLKAHDLITSPAFVVIKAVEEFRDKTISHLEQHMRQGLETTMKDLPTE